MYELRDFRILLKRMLKKKVYTNNFNLYLMRIDTSVTCSKISVGGPPFRPFNHYGQASMELNHGIKTHGCGWSSSSAFLNLKTLSHELGRCMVTFAERLQGGSPVISAWRMDAVGWKKSGLFFRRWWLLLRRWFLEVSPRTSLAYWLENSAIEYTLTP